MDGIAQEFVLWTSYVSSLPYLCKFLLTSTDNRKEYTICAAYSEAQCTSYKHKLLSSLKYGVNYKLITAKYAVQCVVLPRRVYK